ncbi:divalent-cation tolerance protein CutA [Desulforhopalus sp. 52FAK]
MKNIIVLHTTVSKIEDAQKIASLLLGEKLIGCAQIDGPIESIYTWKDAIETEQEYRLSVKTTNALSTRVMEMIQKHHPYEVPEIVGNRLEYCSKEYQNWLIGEVNNESA